MSEDDPYLDDIFELAKKEAEQNERDVHVVELLGPYLRKRPTDGFAWFIYGDSLRVIGRKKESLGALFKALELVPENKKYMVYSRIALANRGFKPPEEAEKWFKKAVDSDSNTPGWLWGLRGANLAAMERCEEALNCYNTALTRDDVDKEEIFLNMGLLYRAAGNYVEAREFFIKALEIDKNCHEAKIGLEGLVEIDTTMRNKGAGGNASKLRRGK